MNRVFVTIAVGFLIVGCSRNTDTPAESGNSKSTISADAIYLNGQIYTVNEDQPWAEALAIKDGRFLTIGSNADAEEVVGSETLVVDLQGKMVMPGMIDLHHHLLTVADDTSQFEFENPTDIDSMVAQIKAYADADPHAPIIKSGFWGLGVFPNDSPQKELLDAVVSDRPVFLMSQSGHSAWVNTKAFEMAEVSGDTPQTEKVIFDTDPDTGKVSGTVREYGMAVLLQSLPKTPPQQMLHRIEEISGQFAAAGFTTLKLAEGRPHQVEAAKMAEEQGRLSLRLMPCWEWESHYISFSDDEMADVMANWQDYQSDLIDPRCVKIFADGGPDSYTSLLYEDYEGRPGFRGQTHRSPEALFNGIKEFNAGGLGVMVHALGDGTAGQVIDVFKEVREQNGDNDAVLHFSHAWMTVPDDFARLSEVSGVAVDFSPALNIRHPTTEFTFVPPIGEERYERMFNVRSAIDAGLPVGFGSDFPSMLYPDVNGFLQMQGWITRIDPMNQSVEPLNPGQAITLEEAVWGFTMGGAMALGFDWPQKVGSIEAGKLADFIVLDRNIFETPITELYRTKVERTVLGGNITFDSM